MEAAPALVAFDEAKRHVREVSDVAQTDADIQAKLNQATAFVLKLCGALADATWTEFTVPAPVHTAILLHLSEIYTDRGDAERLKPFGEDVVHYLMASGYRDPVLS